jgi:prephenate dehydrogenase
MMEHRVPSSVGVIGGRGQLGSWLARLLGKHGVAVSIADIGTDLSNIELVKNSEVVVVSVPIGVTDQVLREIAPHVRSDQLVLDLTSVKTPFVPVLESLRGEVLSLHPMFSPSVATLEGQSCVVCPLREGMLGLFFRHILEQEGVRLVTMSPDEHDRTMAVVQGMTHFQAIVAGHCMTELGFNPLESLAVASPVYRVRLAMIGRILAQDARLYAEIQIFNPFVREALSALERSTRVFQRAIEEKDVATFAAEFERARHGLGGFEKVALEESNRVIQALAQK